ncbi:MAG TPA: methylmalonyl-CoA epimerase [Solirubrobacteraceae bacterium]|nr:methylmalonyl-CoA epimerase [Solirubrobacteraceae bacterium]
MFERINHVGIAVTELEPAIAHYSDSYGVEVIHRELLDDETIDAALVGAGEDRLELVAPLRADSPLGRFIARRGPGMHHIAYEVSDIDAALDRLRDGPITLIDEVAREGIRGTRVAFLHPASNFGVLTELVEPAG